MRSRFDEQLNELNTELITMGSMCENAISMSAQALMDGDIELANRAAQYDAEIDQKERDIETLCMKLLLQQQPVAHDLRTISSALKMITDMERIGDQSADIAEIVATAKIAASDETLHIAEMSRAVKKMVTESVDAFVGRDVKLARDTINYDDVVDGLFDKVKDALAERFKKGGEPEYALDLLMIAKYFERIGDHATNIAEWVLYSVTGRKE
ncbi:MAG: phosphate signaling complex protein PhoU [Eubacteriales bacterium]|nr:phosphate signaling complex protein PhoU [Eubacteriales bacterium]